MGATVMRWPWMSRRLHDERVDHLCALIARYEGRVDGLLAQITTMHATMIPRSVTPEPSVPVAPPPKRLPSDVALAIREQSGGDPRLAAHLRAYATGLEREGRSADEIALALGEWETSEPISLPAEIRV